MNTEKKNPRDAVIVAAGRSAMAKAFKGSFAETHPIEYGAQVLKGVLTKLDVLSSLKEIPLIVAYQKGDQRITEFDPTEDMGNCTPVIEMVPGWQEDISGCRTYEELPENARNYIETLERLLNHKIQMISVGARRDQYLMKEI